ncbi:MAG: amidohydrolase family protein [Candidatus Saliniplasma sp.]
MVKKEIIPLLYDHHNHPSQYAAFFESANISGVKSKEEAVSIIKQNTQKDRVNVVLGWNNSFFSFSKDDLNRLPPVVICNLSFHGYVSNNKAEELVKERFGSSDILKKLRDPDWMESNLPNIMRFLIEVEDLNEEKLRTFYDHLLERGIWRTEDMLIPSESALENFKSSGLNKRTEFWTDLSTYQKMSSQSQKEIKGIKIFTDGALGPKTAAIEEPYSGDNYGVLLHEQRTLEELIEEVETDHAAIHAIGSRAIKMVVNSLENIDKSGITLPKIRMEHAQFIDKETAETAKSLGITLSMQPNFSLDSEHYSDRLSEKYLKMNNPFRMLIDDADFVLGKDLIFGSDGMPHGVKAALESSLFPPYSSQRVTLDEFQRAYCVEDKSLGSIDIVIDEDKEEVVIEEINIQ